MRGEAPEIFSSNSMICASDQDSGKVIILRRDNEKEIVGRQHVGMFTQTEAVIVRLRTRWSSKSIEEHCPLPTD